MTSITATLKGAGVGGFRMYSNLFFGEFLSKKEIKNSKFENEVILEDFTRDSDRKGLKIARLVYLVFSV